MRSATLRRWSEVHLWTSLVCTLVLFILCMTGLPLIFSDEIEGVRAAPPRPVTASLDHIVAEARVSSAFVRVADDEGLVYVGPRGGERPLIFDGVSGMPAHRGASFGPGVMDAILAIHGELLAGLPGKLLIAAMGLSALASIVSGVILYGPFAGERPFGDVRRGRSGRLAWLDRHNVIGISSAMWLFIVSATGIMNAIEAPLFTIWRATIGDSLPRGIQGPALVGPEPPWPPRAAPRQQCGWRR